MCSFESDRIVAVCEVAIGQVREPVDRELGSGVRYNGAEGGGTLVEATDQIEADRFAALVRLGIDQSNGLGRP